MRQSPSSRTFAIAFWTGRLLYLLALAAGPLALRPVPAVGAPAPPPAGARAGGASAPAAGQPAGAAVGAPAGRLSAPRPAPAPPAVSVPASATVVGQPMNAWQRLGDILTRGWGSVAGALLLSLLALLKWYLAEARMRRRAYAAALREGLGISRDQAHQVLRQPGEPDRLALAQELKQRGVHFDEERQALVCALRRAGIAATPDQVKRIYEVVVHRLRGRFLGEKMGEQYAAGLNAWLASLEPPAPVPTPTLAPTELHVVVETPPAADTGAARDAYLRHVRDQTANVPLHSLDTRSAGPGGGQAGVLGLSDVYIPLHVMVTAGEENESRPSPEARKQERIPVQDALRDGKPTVLLGPPGSGKSTFARYLAHCLAREALHEAVPAGSEERAPLGLRPGAIPVLVELRDLAAWAAEKPRPRDAGLLHLYVEERLLPSAGAADYWPELRRLLREGKAFLLLDGLDEVRPGSPEIALIKEMLDALPGGSPACPLLVTCRVRSYQEETWQLANPAWRTLELAPLKPGEANLFIDSWYGAQQKRGLLEGGEARAADLKSAVRKGGLTYLAGNPLLLTVMAIVHTHKLQLPDQRAVLFNDAVDVLLTRWERTHTWPGGPARIALEETLAAVGADESALREVLSTIAFDVHQGAAAAGQGTEDDREATADIPQGTLEVGLASLHRERSLEWAEGLIEVMKHRSGLLVEEAPEVFRFPHRWFQEYLAGCHLAAEVDFPERAAGLALGTSYWWETIRWSVGCLAHCGARDRNRPLALLENLLPDIPAGELEDEHFRLAWLAGQCLQEMTVQRAEGLEWGKRVADRVRARLCLLLEQGRLTVSDRLAAGSLLGALGDPRNLGEMLTVPAGTFLMGDGRQKNNPAHKVTLSAFEIRKYPVTNQEYWEFVKAGHHAPPEHWVGDAPPPEIRNHPVVYVSWDDAQAWCEWATGRYDLPGLSLPTEAQWERAARGTDGREFPWKGPWNRHYCLNSEVREASSTGPVGVFPSGASPAGCLDMAGNVWEWCADWYGEDYYRKAPARDPAGPASGVSRVLRGGSWSNDLTGHFRCACRVDDSPDRIIGILGFRAARTVR